MTEADEADVIELQYQRRVIVDKLSKENIVAMDPAQLSALLRTMADMDRSIINRTKIKQAEKENDTSAEHNALLTQLLLRHKTVLVEGDERELIALPDIDYSPVPGELD